VWIQNKPPWIIRLVVVFGIATAFLQAQNSETRRPIIGIALSGGGALGLAHIGVLRYLEEHHIPVDRIAGTSMGGLLGGLYATGHDSASIEKTVREAQWSELLRATPRFEDRSVVEKQEWNRVEGNYSVQLGRGFTLPAGLNPGQGLVLLLSGQTAAYLDVQDFDKLPIPFRCVATDLVDGKAFVLREGPLPKALRATMAIPGIFTPVQWENRVLSDGGLVNNLPTDVVKDMGADVIIAVSLHVGSPKADELDTITKILRQSVNISVSQNEIDSVKLADIDIAVDLGSRTLLDFSDTHSIVELGYAAAARNQTALERLSVSPQQWEEYLQARKARERSVASSGPILEVSVTPPNIQRDAEHDLLRKSGGPISRERLDDLLEGVTATTGLRVSYYGWRTDGEKTGYHVELEPRRKMEMVIRPSLFYQFSPGERSRPAFRLSGAAVPQDTYKSRLLADLNLGDNPALTVEYYRAIGGSAYSVAPGFSLERTHFSVYNGDDRTDLQRKRFAGSLYVGMGTGRQVQLRIGATGGLERYGGPRFPGPVQADDSAFVNTEVTGIINTQDSGQLPARGLRVNGSAGYSFRKHSFPYLDMNFDHFHPVSKQFSIFEMGQLGTSFGRQLTLFDQFTAGGLTQMDAFRYQELRANTLLALGGGAIYRGFRPMFGAWYEAAGLEPFESASEFKQSATLGAFLPTPLGLTGLTFSSDLHRSFRVRVSLGSFWNRP